MDVHRRFLLKSGYYGGILATLIFIFSLLFSYIQILLYYPSFNPFENWMSELGVGPYGIIFNFSVMISSILLAVFFTTLLFRLKKEEQNATISNLCLLSGYISVLGLFLIGLFPMNDIGQNNFFHGMAALIYWAGSFTFWGLLSSIINKNAHFQKWKQLIVLLTLFSWILFLISFLGPLFIPLVEESFPIIFQWNAHVFNFISIGMLIKYVKDSV